jgi:hypothetical protein
MVYFFALQIPFTAAARTDPGGAARSPFGTSIVATDTIL